MKTPARSVLLGSALLAAAATLSLAGCGAAGTAAAGNVASGSAGAASAAQAAHVASQAAAALPRAAASTCTPGPTASFSPLASLPKLGNMPSGSLEQIIATRGYLVVGVSGDTRLLGARNSLRGGQLEGFDIDMARQVAKAIFGDPNRVEFRVITAAQRQPLVNQGAGTKAQPLAGVDMVARAMTMTCDRWNDTDANQRVAFSSVYLLAHQRVLVRADSPAAAQGADPVAVLAAAKARVCAPAGSTSLARIQQIKGIQPVSVQIHSDCLALWQEGKVDAITGDDAILAGFQDQDPHAVVVGSSLEDEPYGLAVANKHPEFAQFINAVLAQVRGNGTWQQLYNTWLRSSLGPAAPPAATYGRNP